ncbi:MAG TPA: hypothetical protein VL979_08130 [Solirubrobacteraceae bacterium]|nr:hypothetical protein [Solirubrobacteraceae bacterium]
MPDQLIQRPTRRQRRRRSRWRFYAILTLCSFIYLCTGHIQGLIGVGVCGAYTLYHFPRRPG